MKIPTIKKHQKPIDADIHFKYKCPDVNCSCLHWLSLKETQTKNFKIVCDCGLVFKPKQIQKIKVLYSKSIKKTKTIPAELLEKTIKILTKYGFTSNEITHLCTTHYTKSNSETPEALVKYILQNLENNNEQH